MNNNKTISPQRHEDTKIDLRRVRRSAANNQRAKVYPGAPRNNEQQRRAAYRRRPACQEYRQDACVTNGSAALPYASNSYLLTPNSCKSRAAGFTLIEILVVLSIIVLLIAILVPAAILAERYAYSSATEGDLAAIGQALSVYHSDFNMYPDSDLCASATNLYYSTAPNKGIPSGHADDYLAECLLGYLPGVADGYPASGPAYAGTGTGSAFPNTAGFTMQPYKKVYGPYMPTNAQNITPDTTGNYYFSGDFPPTAGTPQPILYFSATASPSSDYVFGAAPGQGIFCSADDPGGAPSGLVPLTTGTPPIPNQASLFLKLIGDKTGTNLATGGTITGRNSYLLVAPGPSQLEFAGDSLVYGGQ